MGNGHMGSSSVDRLTHTIESITLATVKIFWNFSVITYFRLLQPNQRDQGICLRSMRSLSSTKRLNINNVCWRTGKIPIKDWSKTVVDIY